MATCKNVAEYFLSRVQEDVGDTISHLKLQKLVYYAQGFTLAITGEPLFDETIKAWEHGPVTPSLYYEYKEFGGGAIPPCAQGSANGCFSPGQLEILDAVHEMYGQFSAWKLRNLTHEEEPWIEAYPDGIISRDSMKDYFKTLLVEE